MTERLFTAGQRLPAASLNRAMVAVAALEARLGDFSDLSGYSVTATDSAAARALSDRFATIRNVRDFGAAGDGSTDDTAAIQAAANALSAAAGGGVVYFPPGRYKTSAPISITKHCTTFRGEVLGQNNSIGSEIVGSANHDLIRVTGSVSFIGFENLAMSHSGAATHTTPSTLLVCQNVANLTIRNCKFANIWNGILLDGVSQARIETIEIRNALAASGASYGLGTSNVSGDTLGIHIRGITLFGINTTPGSVALDLRGAATIYVSQAPITKWDIGIQCAQDPVTLAGTSFIRLHQVETENCNSGVVVTDTTRFYAVDCQTALATAASGWRFAGSGVGQVSLVGCMAVNCMQHGFFLDTCPNASFSIAGCVASGNSQTGFGTYSGLTISNTNNVTVVGGRYGGGGANSLPSVVTHLNGIRSQGAGNTGISIVGANLEGNTAPFASGATAAPIIFSCRGYEDAFLQVRGTTQANVVSLRGANAGFGVAVGADGTDTNINMTLSPKGTGNIVAGGPFVLPPYTVATLPAAAGNTRGMIYVTNESGGAIPAFSDGTNWRRVTDRAIVS